MQPKDFARINAIANRLHAKKHRGWNCDDVHPVVHADHVAACRKQARQIVEKELSR